MTEVPTISNIDFFLVGHPRSGSGLVDACLAAHPDLFLARKELHYFGEDLDYNHPPRDQTNYLRHFRAGASSRFRGETSTWYLYSRTAAREIAAARPDARIVILLRNPVNWLWSLHGHFLFTGDETDRDLARALRASPEEFEQKESRSTQPHHVLSYRNLVAYSEQVGRYLKAFGTDRVHVVLLDDLRAQPVRAIGAVLDFLGVTPRFPGLEHAIRGTRRARNAYRSVRSRTLRGLLRLPKNVAIRRGLLRASVPGWGTALRVLHRANIKTIERPAVPRRLRNELLESFREEIRRTQELIGRDLRGWLREEA